MTLYLWQCFVTYIDNKFRIYISVHDIIWKYILAIYLAGNVCCSILDNVGMDAQLMLMLIFPNPPRQFFSHVHCYHLLGLRKWSRIFITGTGSALFRITKVPKSADFTILAIRKFSSHILMIICWSLDSKILDWIIFCHDFIIIKFSLKHFCGRK